MESLFNIVEEIVQGKEELSTPNEFCPNCWGRQEYGGNFVEAVKKEKIDLHNLENKRGWVRAYAQKYLHSIKLKTSNGKQICTSCSN
jgi:hypothetical protein